MLAAAAALFLAFAPPPGLLCPKHVLPRPAAPVLMSNEPAPIQQPGAEPPLSELMDTIESLRASAEAKAEEAKALASELRQTKAAVADLELDYALDEHFA